MSYYEILCYTFEYDTFQYDVLMKNILTNSCLAIEKINSAIKYRQKSQLKLVKITKGEATVSKKSLTKQEKLTVGTEQ